MMINKNSPLPIYYQIEEHIKDLIDRKQLKPGDCLPSEREFAEQYQVSRMTIRQAITNLVNSGYVYRIKGKGTFVADQNVIELKLHGITSFTENIQALGMTPSSKIIEFRSSLADKNVATKLKINENESVYEIQRIRLANQIPMALETSFLSTNIVKNLSKETAAHSLYEYIQKTLGLSLKYSTQTIEASAANKKESELLGIKKGSPILLMERITFLSDDQPIEFTKSIYRGDRYKFVVKIDQDS